MFCVETFSFLPKCQRDGRDLACEREASHLRLHPLGQQSCVKVLQWSRATTGAQGRTFEDLLHLVVVILIQTTDLLWLFGTLQLSVYITMLCAVVRLYPQATVGPQLPLAAESVWRLHQGQQQCGPKRADRGNLAQYFHRLMFPTLGQKFSSHRVPQNQQSIQLQIQQLCSAVHAGVRNLAQPLLPMAWSVDLPTSAGNAPASVQRLEPTHHPPLVFADGQITTRQLPQRPQPVFSVVDRAQQSGAQQLGQLPRIHLVTLAALFQ